MPKRSVEHSSKMKPKRRRIILSSDSSDSKENSSIGTPPPDEVTPIVLDETREAPPLQPGAEAEPAISDAANVTADAITSGADTVAPPVPELDPEILLALGAKTDEGPQYGDKIHENLVSLWTPLLKKGMSKEDKDKILKEYLIPQNCKLLQAPKLNPEISAAISESARNRDKKMTNTQQQLGVGITAVNRAMDLLLSKDGNKLKAIKHLSDACRILCDLHSCESQARIKMITPSLEKNFLNIIQDACRDETLFGDKLHEKIKASKVIEKQGLQIKKAANPTPSTSSTSRSTQNRGNWSGPPRYTSSKTNRGSSKKTPQSSTRKAQPTSAPPAKTVTKPQTRAQAQK